MSSLKDKKDLTRWNRAGLSRFRYVDGNAVTHLETLRQLMREAFTEGGVNRWSALESAAPDGAGESPQQRQTRWRNQYHDGRRDYGWEILRSYARAAHVLTEHLDAYANESYLNTATQWDNLRRLVKMLDYHPAPPASAQTPIALLAREGRSGTVEAGFAFKNKPRDGSPPVVFETLMDLDIEAGLNRLKAADWDKSRKVFGYAKGRFPLSAPVEGVSVGALGVLLAELGGKTVGAAVRVRKIDGLTIRLDGGTRPAGFPARVRYHRLRLLLNPGFKEAPKLRGSKVVILDRSDHGLGIGSSIAWKGAGGNWRASRVTAVDGARIALSGQLPAEGEKLYGMVRAEANRLSGVASPARRVILPLGRQTERVWKTGLGVIGSWNVKTQKAEKEDGTKLDAMYHYLDGGIYPSVLYVPESDPVAEVVTAKPRELAFDGDPGNLVTGGWVVARAGAAISAASITKLDEGEDGFELALSPQPGGAELLFGDFEMELRPADYDINDSPVFKTQPALRSDSYSVLPLDLKEIPAALKVGRRLIVAGKDQAMEVTVKEVDTANRSLKVEPAIPGSELGADGKSDNYTRYHTVIYGNVVDSGHGETQKQSILGAGDATRSGQTFDLDVAEVSFVSDSTFPAGVRADLEVSVEGRIWWQVPGLNDSGPEDPHYTVRVKEDGTLCIRFGDGFHGRRLPSGNNNVRVRYRKGSGLAGNLAALSLEKAVKPHALVDALVQPIASTGGNDMEAVETMRDNAPASVLTLERAVSVADFTHLAATNSSVWQARALRRKPGVGRAERIDVVVVPAGGGELGALGGRLASFLSAHTLPGVKIGVVPYQSVILDLKLTLRIKEDEYDPDLVAASVKEQLLDTFSLENGKLGEPFYRSQVVAAVEGVEGVVNCRCEINPGGFYDAKGAVVTPRQLAYGVDGDIKRIAIAEHQVIHTDKDLSALEIVTQAFTL